MGDIGEHGEVAARDERARVRIELAIEPVRPYPVDAQLGRGSGADGPEHGAGADRKQFTRQLHLDVLTQPLERREVANDVWA